MHFKHIAINGPSPSKPTKHAESSLNPAAVLQGLYADANELLCSFEQEFGTSPVNIALEKYQQSTGETSHLEIALVQKFSEEIQSGRVPFSLFIVLIPLYQDAHMQQKHHRLGFMEYLIDRHSQAYTRKAFLLVTQDAGNKRAATRSPNSTIDLSVYNTLGSIIQGIQTQDTTLTKAKRSVPEFFAKLFKRQQNPSSSNASLRQHGKVNLQNSALFTILARYLNTGQLSEREKLGEQLEATTIYRRSLLEWVATDLPGFLNSEYDTLKPLIVDVFQKTGDFRFIAQTLASPALSAEEKDTFFDAFEKHGTDEQKIGILTQHNGVPNAYFYRILNDTTLDARLDRLLPLGNDFAEQLTRNQMQRTDLPTIATWLPDSLHFKYQFMTISTHVLKNTRSPDLILNIMRQYVGHIRPENQLILVETAMRNPIMDYGTLIRQELPSLEIQEKIANWHPSCPTRTLILLSLLVRERARPGILDPLIADFSDQPFFHGDPRNWGHALFSYCDTTWHQSLTQMFLYLNVYSSVSDERGTPQTEKSYKKPRRPIVLRLIDAL